MKQKTTIKLTLFSRWDPQIINCRICNKMKLLQKGIIETQKLEPNKTPLGRTKATTNIWTQSALESLKEIIEPDL